MPSFSLSQPSFYLCRYCRFVPGPTIFPAPSALEMDARVERTPALLNLAAVLVEKRQFQAARSVLLDELRHVQAPLVESECDGEASLPPIRNAAFTVVGMLRTAVGDEHAASSQGAAGVLLALMGLLDQALTLLQAAERSFSVSVGGDPESLASVRCHIKEVLRLKMIDGESISQALAPRGAGASTQSFGCVIATALKRIADQELGRTSTGDAPAGPADKVLQLLSTLEARRLTVLEDSVSPSLGDRSAELRSFCLALAGAGWDLLFSGCASPPAHTNACGVELPDVSQFPKNACGLLGADVWHAFVTCEAAFAGLDVSRRNKFWEPPGYTVVDRINGIDDISSILLMHGQTLFVATVKDLAWSEWVDFFAAPVVGQDASSFSSGKRPLEAAASGRFSVNRQAWTAFCAHKWVLKKVRAVVDLSRPTDVPVDGVVFCGHGFGAAMSQLLAGAWEAAIDNPRLPSTSLVTFGCPAIGDVDFQARVPIEMRHTRLFVNHDPVAGLPYFSCDGLRLGPSAEVYSWVQADEHWSLSRDGRAHQTNAASPSVPSLAVAGVAFASNHSLAAYAECLARHCKAVAVDTMPSIDSTSFAPPTSKACTWRGATPPTLFEAALDGDVARITELIALGGAVQATTEQGDTALHWAAAGGHRAAIRELISAGAQVTARCSWGNYKRVCQLLDERIADVSSAVHDQGDDVTVLHWAGRSGRAASVMELVASAADVEAKDSRGRVALHWAVQSGAVEAVDALLVAGADVQAKDYNRSFALHWAARSGSTEAVEKLVKAGADVNAVNQDGWTPLHEAVTHGQTRTVGALLSHDCSAAPVSYAGMTPLCLAVALGHRDIIDLLPPDHPPDADSSPALEAIMHQRVELLDTPQVRPFLHTCDRETGDSLLHVAARRADLTSVVALLRFDADVRRINVADETPLASALLWYIKKLSSARDLARVMAGRPDLHLRAVAEGRRPPPPLSKGLTPGAVSDTVRRQLYAWRSMVVVLLRGGAITKGLTRESVHLCARVVASFPSLGPRHAVRLVMRGRGPKPGDPVVLEELD